MAHGREQQGEEGAVPLGRITKIQELVVVLRSGASDEEFENTFTVQHGTGDGGREEMLRPVEDEGFESVKTVLFWVGSREEFDGTFGDTLEITREH